MTYVKSSGTILPVSPTSAPATAEQVKPRTYLPPDRAHVTNLLSQDQVWLMGNGSRVAISDLALDHLINITTWLDGQVGYILSLFEIDSDALAAPAMINWLHEQPLLRALDAARIRLDREQEANPPEGLRPQGWLLRPLAAIDVETTGVDIESDRLVSFALGVAEEPGDWRAVTKIIDPGVPIPHGATLVHGITDQLVAEQGVDPEGALKMLQAALVMLADREVPLIGHNIRFDLSILDRAMRRHLDTPLRFGQVLDTLVLDKALDTFRRGKRTLGAACQHYGVDNEINHVADTDAKRALRLLWAIMTSPKAREVFDGRLPTLAELQTLQARWYAEQAQHMAEWRSRTGQSVDQLDTSWPVAERNVASLPSRREDPPWGN